MSAMFLGIDLGTSAVKAVLASPSGIVASASKALTSSALQPGWSEQDPHQWWQACVTLVRQLVTDNRTAMADLQAIGLSGQMHGATLLDSDGNVLRPAILWNDSRAVSECDQLLNALPEFGNIAGINPLPGLTAPKLLWVYKHEPEVYRKIRTILLPKDYIGYRLHGGCVTDTSDAAGTLWLDQERRQWSADLCRVSAVDPDWLPEIRDGNELAGKVSSQAAQQLGIRAGTAVYAGGGDAACGAVALGVVESDRGFISLGTSGQLFIAGRDYSPHPESYVHAFAHTLPQCWYQMAALLNGARPLAWAANLLGVSVDEVLRRAQSVTSAPLFLPYLSGERSPHGDPHIRGCLYGLEDASDSRHFCRAVVESIAFCFADAFDSLTVDSAKMDCLPAIGGGARSDLLLQMIADTTGMTIGRTAQATETGAAWGAARLAMAGASALSISDLEVVPEIARRFEPADSPGLVERLGSFRRLYSALRGAL